MANKKVQQLTAVENEQNDKSKINWKVRIKNKAFWLALIPAVLLLIQVIALYMRHGAGKNKRAMVLIPEGTKVQNYGYYTSYNGTKWLYIQVTLNGVQYTGFSSKTYLKKQ